MTGVYRTGEARVNASPWLVEGLSLFFPAAACLAVLLPLAWVALFAFSLPFAHGIPAGQWHAHEMIFGVYGAALAGFLTSAVPEWTDTRPRRGKSLLVLFFPWLLGRLIGLVGFAIPFAAGSSGMLVALIFSVFWLVSPAFAWLVSRSAETEDRLVVAPEDRQALRVAARRTWLFFETFVTEGGHDTMRFYDPDTYREIPVN